VAHVVRATVILAILWSVAAIGGAVDPSCLEWTGRVVAAVVGSHA
jgi:hypothetical protein